MQLQLLLKYITITIAFTITITITVTITITIFHVAKKFSTPCGVRKLIFACKETAEKRNAYRVFVAAPDNIWKSKASNGV